MLSHLRLLFIVATVVSATAALAPLQLTAIKLFPALSRWLPLRWHRAVTRLVGMKIHVRGEVPAGRPLLIVSNHVSWSDILVLGSVAELSFVAKAEVQRWPGVGLLARLQRTVYVERARRSHSARQADAIAGRLAAGDTMVLFAEGTTGSGHKVMPFKSALFGAIRAAIAKSGHETVQVQPVAIAYTRLHGLPLGRYHQSRAAWPGGMTLLPHLKSFLLDGAYDVDVIFGQAERVSAGSDRKAVATRMMAEVRKAFSDAMRMRA